LRSAAAVPSLVTIARILGAWTAISIVASPLLVLLVRVQARANARLTGRLRRDGWIAAQRA